MNQRIRFLFTPSSLLWIAFILFLAVAQVRYFYKTQSHRSAFQRWSPQLEEMSQGVDIWKKHGFPAPPITALVLRPFQMLPDGWGPLAWAALKAVMALVSLWMIFQMLENTGSPLPFWGKALALLLVLRPIEGDLTHGNVNLMILFFVTLSLFTFTRRQDFWAGLFLGFAIACKLTPALFIPYFLWKRAWKTALAGLFSTALFFWVVPSFYLGFSHNHQCLVSWYDFMVVPYVKEGKITTEQQNQSLPGLAHRLLTESASFSDFVEGQYVAVEMHNIVTLDRHWVNWGVKVCLGLFGLGVLSWCRTHVDHRRHLGLLLEFGVILIAMLLFSERTWKHHCVTLALPFATLVYLLSTSAKNRRLIAGTLVGVVLLLFASSTGVSDVHDRFGKLAMVYGSYTFSFIALLGLHFYLLRRLKQGVIQDSYEIQQIRVKWDSAVREEEKAVQK